jgi:endonuclease YncB( thermonuclease family)
MMRKTLYAAFIAAFFLSTPAAAAGQYDAKVIGVADGDTLTVLFVDGQTKTPRRVRVSGIDAPEKAQAFGAVAREQLSRLAFGRKGHLDCRATDQYGRSVCAVRVDGLDVGLRMVELGLAWHYKRYASSQPHEEAASYAMAENAARAAKTGLWRDLGTAATPVPPWDWRKTSAADNARR